jgi:HEAT repeat protein
MLSARPALGAARPGSPPAVSLLRHRPGRVAERAVQEDVLPDPADKTIDLAVLSAESRARLEQLTALASDLVRGLYDDIDDETREGVARLLVEIGPAAVPPLIRLLCDDPRRGRDEAAAILCEIGEAAVEALIGCFAHDDPEVRGTAAFLFTAMRDAERRAEDPLIALLDDPHELVRQSAAYALGWLDSRRAVPKLISLATRPVQLPDRETDPDAWSEAYPYDSCAAVDALGQIGDPRAVRPLLFLVDSQGPEGPMYLEAVRALGRLGDRRGLRAVRRAFEDAPYQGVFADSLAALDGREALDDLLDLAASDDPEARRSVGAELVALGDPAAAVAVAALLVDPDDEVRGTARAALGWAVDDATAAEIIAGLEDPSDETRAWTIRYLPIALSWSE